MQKWLPLALAVLFFVLLIGTTIFRIVSVDMTSQILLGVSVSFYLLWLLIETRTTRKEIHHDKTPYDRGSLEFYAFARGATTISAIATADLANHHLVWASIGFAIFVSGVALRLLSISSLGELYSHRVRVAEQQTIVSRGPYYLIRHPSYAGMLIAHLGFLTILVSPWAIGAFIALFLPAVVYRIGIEEFILLRENSAYADYCQGRARLIPYVW